MLSVIQHHLHLGGPINAARHNEARSRGPERSQLPSRQKGQHYSKRQAPPYSSPNNFPFKTSIKPHKQRHGPSNAPKINISLRRTTGIGITSRQREARHRDQRRDQRRIEPPAVVNFPIEWPEESRGKEERTELTGPDRFYVPWINRLSDGRGGWRKRWKHEGRRDAETLRCTCSQVYVRTFHPRVQCISSLPLPLLRRFSWLSSLARRANLASYTRRANVRPGSLLIRRPKTPRSAPITLARGHSISRPARSLVNATS